MKSSAHGMRFLLLLSAGLLFACTDPPNGAKAPAATPPKLATAAVQSALVPRETAFDGTVEAVNQSTVSAQTSGRVVELPFDVGDYVEKGAVIARITPTEQRARTQAGEAAVAEARARLAEAQLAFDRTRDVYERKLIAKAQFDKAKADLDSARARLDAALAALAEARESLGHTVVQAPYPGIVVARLVQLGETVAPGRPLMAGVSLEHLRVVVEIPQQHIAPLRKHRRARVLLSDGSSVEATELRIPPNADPSTQTFRVLVGLAEGEHGVFPGTMVKVAFVSGVDRRLLIPASAIVQRGEITGAYVVAPDGAVSLRYLRLATPAGDGRVPVLAGLIDGETVALDPIAAGIELKRTPQATRS